MSGSRSNYSMSTSTMRLLTSGSTVILFSSFFSRSTTADPNITIATQGMTTGDNPFWGPRDNMYFAGKITDKIYRYDHSEQTTSSTPIVDNERQVSFVVPVAGSDVRFAVGLGHSLVTVSWDTTSNKTKNGPVRVESEIPFGVDYPGILTVAKTDGHGRMFIGTNNGTIYRAEPPHGAVAMQLTDVGIPRGFAWNTDYTLFYRSDEDKSVIVRHEFNIDQGEISPDGKVVLDFNVQQLDGGPGGMAMDADDFLWVACTETGNVIQIDPSAGTVLKTIQVSDGSTVTSVAFGMQNLESLFVTAHGQNNGLSSDAMYKVDGTGSTGLKVEYFGLV